jgi:hypothetical protein
MVHELVQEPVDTVEGRIASMGHALMSRHLDQFRDEMRLIAKRERLVAQRDEVRKALGEQAHIKGRELYLTHRAIELQKELDAANIEIAKRCLAA